MMSPRTFSQTSTACAAAMLAYVTVVVVWYAVRSPLGVNHDEHQFMASAFMVARHGLHPYRDFAYFHMPNLVYVYAPFFFTPYPYLGARLFAGLCAVGIGVTTFLLARALFADHGRLSRLAVPVAATALLVHSPVFHDVSSRVWNHTPATLCALLAFLCHCRAIRGDRPVRDFLLSGVSLGMAVGIRSSLAPLVVPFLVAPVVFRAESARAKGWHALVFVAGGVLANAPAVYFVLTHFEDTVFGNLGYARLNTLYRQELSHRTAMTVAGKLVFLKERLFAKPGELPILVVAVYSLALVGVERLRTATRPRFEFVFLLLVTPFAFVGAMAPTPSWSQYYFAPVVLLLWLSLYALAQLRRTAPSEAAALLLGVAALLSFVYAPLPRRMDAVVRDLVRPASWVPVRVHEEADTLRAAVEAPGGAGAVLTLSPLWAVEARLPIYPAFVTGPFGYRVSHLLPADEAAARGLPWGPDIKAFLEEHRPRAILTGHDEARVERPLIDAADALGYRPIETALGRVTGGRGQAAVIWVPPERSAPPETVGFRPH
jgi:4-amino-4-deoxy-L-arabinose transferase-like glycosyltransferase